LHEIVWGRGLAQTEILTPFGVGYYIPSFSCECNSELTIEEKDFSGKTYGGLDVARLMK
jgi:hypothetical protein